MTTKSKHYLHPKNDFKSVNDEYVHISKKKKKGVEWGDYEKKIFELVP